MNKLVKPLIEVIEIDENIICVSGETRGTGYTGDTSDVEVED